MNLKIENKKFDLLKRKVEESILSISNGYIGMRGSFEEGVNPSIASIEGTYINAFYDYFDIQYAAKYTGYPNLYQRMMPVVNMQNIEIYIDNKRYLFGDFKEEKYYHALDMETGEVIRSYEVKITKEDKITFKFKKLLSHIYFELFIQNIEINFDFSIDRKIVIKFPVIFKELAIDKGIPNDPRVNHLDETPFRKLDMFSEQNVQSILYETLRSKQKYVYSTKINGLEDFESNFENEGIEFKKTIKSKIVNIEKFNVMYEQRLYDISIKDSLDRLKSFAKKNYLYYLIKSKEYFINFWNKANSYFGEKNSNILKSNNFNMFQLYTNVGKLPWTNIAAKGLTGEGYAGHYFWDSEIYIITALTLLDSKLAKQMLLFRYNTLDKARERAKVLNHKNGALYPWRTINGEESSTYFPAGTAQYHINGDISFAIINYFKSTRDEEFLFNYGIDILIETSRVWEDKIVISNNVAHINSVTGPDEYQIIVNDDYWTNCVAQFNLDWAVKALNILKIKNYNLYNKKVAELKISKQEIKNWINISSKINHIYDKKLNLNPQHDNFMKRKPVTREYIEQNKPFLRKLHPLSINTLRVTKQADVVLANLFFYKKNKLSTMINNWNFYDKTDTSDSSLSKCIYAIMAARLKIGDLGFNYFKESIKLDLLDVQMNTDRGLHMANMSGTRMFVIYGLLGINVELEYLEIDPRQNDIIDEYIINIEYQKSLINFEIKNKKIIIIKNDIKDIKIKFKTKVYKLTNRLELIL